MRGPEIYGPSCDRFSPGPEGPYSRFEVGAPNVERAQAVSRAEGNRGQVGEPRDEHDRRTGRQVEVIGYEQAEKARGER